MPDFFSNFQLLFPRFQLLRFIAPGYVFSLLRIHPYGRLDYSFGHRARVITGDRTVSEDHADEVTLQPDGEILISGYSRTQFAEDLTVLRYKNKGRLDKSFASSGKLVIELSSFGSMVPSFAVQNDG